MRQLAGQLATCKLHPATSGELHNVQRGGRGDSKANHTHLHVCILCHVGLPSLCPEADVGKPGSSRSHGQCCAATTILGIDHLQTHSHRSSSVGARPSLVQQHPGLVDVQRLARLLPKRCTLYLSQARGRMPVRLQRSCARQCHPHTNSILPSPPYPPRCRHPGSWQSGPLPCQQGGSAGAAPVTQGIRRNTLYNHMSHEQAHVPL